jgi:flagellar basal body rod protein FlgG
MDGIDWAAGAMAAARTRLDIAAENLANVSSDGFEAVRARGRLGARGVTIERELVPAHGALRPTGAPFDLAISGEGSFTVRGAGGRVVRTRDGAFVRDADGSLRDRHGRTLLDRAGRVIVVPQGGTLEGARLGLPSGSRLRVGFLERPAVDAIGQMIDILSAERSFESAQKVVAAIDRTAESAANAARVK